MDALTPLEQVGEVLGIDFEGEEYETLNGYLTSILGDVYKRQPIPIITKKQNLTTEKIQ